MRPQAEFAGASGRGPRWVRKFIHAAKRICKKRISFEAQFFSNQKEEHSG
jgi:hypothetical protein